MARYSRADLDRLFAQYAHVAQQYGLVREGYTLTLHHGTCWELYETETEHLPGGGGSRHLGQEYLGRTVTQACEALIDRKSLLWDIFGRLSANGVDVPKYRHPEPGEEPW